MPETFSISQCIDFISVPRMLVKEKSISPQARFLYITALSFGDGCSKSSVMDALGVGDFRYRGMVRELEKAGYIRRRQGRGENGMFECSVLELTLPKPKISTGRQFAEELLRRQNPSSEPYVKNSRSVAENQGKTQNPSSEPYRKNLRSGSQERQNPSSEPYVKNSRSGRDLPVIKQQQHREEEVYPTRFNNEGHGRDKGYLYSKLSDRIQSDSEYALTNISETEFGILFDAIAGACTDSRFASDQRILCRPLIDAMCFGLEFADALGAVGFMIGQERYRRSSFPSYWVADFCDDVRRIAADISCGDDSEHDDFDSITL